MTAAVCGDELGNIKYLVCSQDPLPTTKNSTLVKGSGDAVQTLALDSASVSAGYSSGTVALYNFNRSEDTLNLRGSCKPFGFRPGGQYIGMSILNEKVIACSNIGILSCMDFHDKDSVSENCHTRPVPTRLKSWRVSPNNISFVCGGEEVLPSVWDLERVLSSTEVSDNPSSLSGKRKRKDDLLPGEVWRAKNLPNDSLGLRQPIRINSIDFASHSVNQQHDIVVGTELGDIRRYDTRTSRQHTSRWHGITMQGRGVSLVKKGTFEHQLFFADGVNSLSCLDLRTGAILYSYKGFAGAVTSLVCSDSVSVASSLDGFIRVLSSPAPPDMAGQATSNRGNVLQKEYMKSQPVTLVLDGDANKPPKQANVHAGDEDIWDQMEVTELQKLERLITGDNKEKTIPIQDSLDSLLINLQGLKDTCDSLETDLPEQLLLELSASVDSSRKDVDARQKEIYSVIVKLGKTIDKNFPNSLPSYPLLFSSPNSKAALDKTIALHFLRTGNFDVAETFISESSLDISPELKDHFLELYNILEALRCENVSLALQWVHANRDFLQARCSPLEFYLHRSQYIRTLFSTYPPRPLLAIAYARDHLRPFYAQYPVECRRLTGCLSFLPLSKMQLSPYMDLASSTLHLDLQPLFAKEYCARLGMSRQVALRVVSDIGGGGALSRIEKSKKVMRDARGEWSRRDELPVEISIPPENRYHSIFSCPVSKEQSTPHNPPMMLACGHVVSSESLRRLGKSGGRVKCTYCPTESQSSAAFQVFF